MIESNGLGCNGVKPLANLDVLQKPSEPHFNKLPGIECFCNLWSTCTEEVVKDCLGTTQVDEALPNKIATEVNTLLEETLVDKRCIFLICKHK